MSKRLFDIFITAPLLILLAPVLLVIAGFVRLKLGRPVLFNQTRPGIGGVPFTIVKFRTMRDLTDDEGNPLPDEQRLTGFGRMLRSTSLDELPELWNVLKGDMSLVGPRPLRMEYLDRYTPEQARRHHVRPGVTGLAQIRGRNAITWAEKFAFDLEYVDHHNLWMDIKILGLTFAAVLKRSGISHSTNGTMPAFEGSEPTETLPPTAPKTQEEG